jgi:hypothetical protein
MDFGFMRASSSDYTTPNKTLDRVIDSWDGYSSYLLIVDEASRYIWVFLTKFKEPPLDIIDTFCKLDRHNFKGIFLGYTAMDQNIIYLDLDSGVVKLSHHEVIMLNLMKLGIFNQLVHRPPNYYMIWASYQNQTLWRMTHHHSRQLLHRCLWV